ncbi:MAG: hypothetical protein KatS3mg087_2163 [Patescibacteria group bacterium]|nr:MAG: hypothetical protein KatS3mg087_2163 [Patescibacteria group bacterium]
MKINIKETLASLKIDFIELEKDVYGLSIASTDESSRSFPVVLFQWTAGDKQEYIRLMIAPFIERPNEGFAFDLFERVLAINEQLPRAKFLLDSDGDLGLALDIDIEEWRSENLERALDVLGSFADYYYEELESFGK